jgi:hypothetical protein
MKLTSFIFTVSFFCLAFIFPVLTSAQEEAVSTSLEFSTVKISKEDRQLKAILTADDGSNLPEGSGLVIKFFAINAEEEMLLGEEAVNSDGKAVFLVNSTAEVKPDGSGYLNFIARFEGNELYGESEASLQVMDAWLEIVFFEEDSARFIQYSGFITNPDGSIGPMADQDVYLYTPRMFSLMKFEDGWLESEGTAVIEFPGTLIGDTLGNIEILVRLEEHPDFGDVQASSTINWAIPKHSERAEGPSRELWTPIAPLWMIVTLIILLAGVWIHYFYAVFQLYMIKRASRKTTPSS